MAEPTLLLTQVEKLPFLLRVDDRFLRRGGAEGGGVGARGIKQELITLQLREGDASTFASRPLGNCPVSVLIHQFYSGALSPPATDVARQRIGGTTQRVPADPANRLSDVDVCQHKSVAILAGIRRASS